MSSSKIQAPAEALFMGASGPRPARGRKGRPRGRAYGGQRRAACDFSSKYLKLFDLRATKRLSSGADLFRFMQF
jgi:hypothetical protein